MPYVPPYVIFVDYVYNVRAKKSERHERGTRRLIKAMHFHGADLQECLNEARQLDATLDDGSGYCTICEVRGYVGADWHSDPRTAQPDFKSDKLPAAAKADILKTLTTDETIIATDRYLAEESTPHQEDCYQLWRYSRGAMFRREDAERALRQIRQRK